MKLTEETYYTREADTAFFSVSQYKSFCKCEAATMAQLRGEYEPPLTRALLVGSFFDSYFDGTLEKFMSEHPEIYTNKNALRADFRRANAMIDRVKNDETFMKFMSGKKQVILTAELFGVPWKCKIDSLVPGICITDLKSCANFQTLPRYGYDKQGAIYQAVCELNGFGKLPFYLCAATKERVPNFDIFQITQPYLDLAMREIESNMPRFIAVKNGEIEPEYCGVCDYCKSIKQARVRDYAELIVN